MLKKLKHSHSDAKHECPTCRKSYAHKENFQLHVYRVKRLYFLESKHQTDIIKFKTWNEILTVGTYLDDYYQDPLAALDLNPQEFTKRDSSRFSEFFKYIMLIVFFLKIGR